LKKALFVKKIEKKIEKKIIKKSKILTKNIRNARARTRSLERVPVSFFFFNYKKKRKF
jgi:hypothetical protein